MFIDTHCHIHDREYHFDIEETLASAHYAGVAKIIVIGTSPSDSEVARAFATAHDNVFYSYGYHPNETYTKPTIPEETSKLVAIGEIGLDYHYTPSGRQQQIAHLEEYLEISKKLQLPAILHVREAFADLWGVLDNSGIRRAVIHSFSDTQQNLDKALSRGFLIGVNGLATFANIPIPPLEHIILETDAPYLTPAPFRGKINEPAYIPEIARWAARHFDITLEQVAKVTTQNAEKFFHI